MFRFSFLTHPILSSQLCFKAFGPPVVPLARQYTCTHACAHTVAVKAAAQLQTKRPTSDTHRLFIMEAGEPACYLHLLYLDRKHKMSEIAGSKPSWVFAAAAVSVIDSPFHLWGK